LLARDGIREVTTPARADVLLMEETGSYKDFRYIEKLLNDPLISRFTEKIFTINTDDCATGLLRGLYTSLPGSRFNRSIHRAVPYLHYPNELVFTDRPDKIDPYYLATWRGNTKSNSLRAKIISHFDSHNKFRFETTNSWLNHQTEEKQSYVDLMLDAKFSLCPAGWAPVSYRIYESMALGRCPVIIADQFVPPAGPHWNGFALMLPEKKLTTLYSLLETHEDQSRQLGQNALNAWNQYFCQSKIADYFVTSLLDLVRVAPLTTKDIEQRRWKSLKFFWSNNWTLPQRVINKARKWARQT
jgi:hypothetical protein